MSDAPTSRFVRVMTYPIYILPVRRFPRVDVRDAIAKSDLPVAAQQLITEVVRRTRLWKGEKAEVALELIAHFRDGVEAGRSADELISSFGSVKTAARLIRRGKRRNRPLWWHARRRCLQAVGAVLLVYAGLALLLVVRHPNPSVDYVAELNRPPLATSSADRAWPLYRDAWIRAQMWKLDDAPLRETDDKRANWLRPGHPHWGEAVAFLREHKSLLDAAREAGCKPSLGWEYRIGSFAAMSSEDRAAFGPAALALQGSVPRSRADQLFQQSTLFLTLPFLAPMRMTANLLAADMRLAASEGDAERVLADYRALTGMTRQVSQTPIVVNELVGMGITSLADQTLMEINQSTSQSLAGRRVDLLHAMSAATGSLKVSTTGERLMFLDLLQRIYSDNGRGDGSPTFDGLQLLLQFEPIAGPLTGTRSEPQTSSAEVLRALAIPAAVATMASRKEVAEEADRVYALAERDIARPLWIKLHSPGSAELLSQEWKLSLAKRVRYPLLTAMMPSLTRASQTADQGRALHEAAMIALALEAYRDKAGQYPSALADLVPHYFPAVPLDYSTGGPLRYKLIDGKPLLYGLGKDGVDDGGVWTDKKTHWSSVPDTGDWVLYPPVEVPRQ